MSKPIVLAFSGGLDTSFLVPWLQERYACPVITATIDTGGLDDAARQAIATRAAALKAAEHHLIDARADFFHETLRFLIMGNVLRGHVYPLCVGAERALQARLVAELAIRLDARAVAHGSTAAGNDQVRFEVALRTVAPQLEVLAPVRDEGFSREHEIAYLCDRKYDFPFVRAAYSINQGMWGTTIGGKETTDTIAPLPEEAWVLTRNAFINPKVPSTHTLGFVRGIPSSWDGATLNPVTLIEQLNAIGASYGIGRGIHLGDTIFGLKGRVAFEAPAATIMITAHRELEKLTMTGRQQRVKDQLAVIYGDLVHEAQYFEPTCRDIEAFFISSQARVSGDVTVRLQPGSLFINGVSSPYSLRSASKAVYGEAAGEWTAADARGFARLLALPSMLYARARGVDT